MSKSIPEGLFFIKNSGEFLSDSEREALVERIIAAGGWDSVLDDCMTVAGRPLMGAPTVELIEDALAYAGV